MDIIETIEKGPEYDGAGVATWDFYGERVQVRSMADGSLQVEGNFEVSGSKYRMVWGFDPVPGSGCPSPRPASEWNRAHLTRPPFGIPDYDHPAPKSRLDKLVSIAAVFATDYLARYPGQPEATRLRYRQWDLEHLEQARAELERGLAEVVDAIGKARRGESFNGHLHADAGRLLKDHPRYQCPRCDAYVPGPKSRHSNLGRVCTE